MSNKPPDFNSFEFDVQPILESMRRANEAMLQSVASAIQPLVQQQTELIVQAMSRALQESVRETLQRFAASFGELADRLLKEAREASQAIG